MLLPSPFWDPVRDCCSWWWWWCFFSVGRILFSFPVCAIAGNQPKWGFSCKDAFLYQFVTWSYGKLTSEEAVMNLLPGSTFGLSSMPGGGKCQVREWVVLGTHKEVDIKSEVGPLMRRWSVKPVQFAILSSQQGSLTVQNESQLCHSTIDMKPLSPKFCPLWMASQATLEPERLWQSPKTVNCSEAACFSQGKQ